MEKLSRNTRCLAVAASFLTPMLLTGIIWFPLLVIYTIGSVMDGWSEIPGIIILLVLFIFLSLAPQLLLKKFGIQPKVPVLLFLLGILLNILAVAATVLVLSSFDKIAIKSD